MSMSLLGWRREVAALYAAYRAAPSPEAGWAAWRAGRDVLLRDHPDSPLGPGRRRGFAGLPVAAYDPALRFEVALDTDAAPGHLDVPTGTDGVVPFDRVGVLHLPGLGSLDAWWLGSYGGGRYLLDTVKGADHGGSGDLLVVDLNLAYHPSCAYDPAWACPLAPPGNVLDAPVAAGEQLPPGGWY